MVNVQALPDKGERLLKQVEDLEAALSSLNLETEGAEEGVLIQNLEAIWQCFGKGSVFVLCLEHTEIFHGF